MEQERYAAYMQRRMREEDMIAEETKQPKLQLRSSVIKEHTFYTVEMYEDGELIQSRDMITEGTAHSLSFAEDCAENWRTGLIK
jgi:hypothetical protein